MKVNKVNVENVREREIGIDRVPDLVVELKDMQAASGALKRIEDGNFQAVAKGQCHTNSHYNHSFNGDHHANFHSNEYYNCGYYKAVKKTG